MITDRSHASRLKCSTNTTVYAIE